MELIGGLVVLGTIAYLSLSIGAGGLCGKGNITEKTQQEGQK